MSPTFRFAQTLVFYNIGWVLLFIQLYSFFIVFVQTMYQLGRFMYSKRIVENGVDVNV